MAHDVFICHSSKDKKIADAICAKLEQNKIRCWIAPRDVVPGSNFAESIVAAIHAARVTVLVFSASSNESPHVSHELERSVSLGLPILPFRVDDVVPSPALEYFISSAHWLDALTPPIEKHIDSLVSTVAVLLDHEVEPVAPTPEGRPHARMTRRRWIAAGVGTAAVAGAVALGLVLTLGHGSAPDRTTGTPTPSATTTGSAVTAFTDDFTAGIGSGWTWLNEDPATWQVTPQGWVRVQPQESPPYRNVLLRDAPKGNYTVKVTLRFPPTPSTFAGIVFTGDDPDNRMQFGWSGKGLASLEYADGSLAAGGEMATKDLPVGASREARLVIEVTNGVYRARFYDAKVGDYWDLNTSALNPEFTHVGLFAYRTQGTGGGAAEFDSFAVY